MFLYLKAFILLFLFNYISTQSHPFCGQLKGGPAKAKRAIGPPGDIDPRNQAYYGWITQVQRKDSKGDFSYNECIANILNEHWLISTASCLKGNASQYQIFMPNRPTDKKKLENIVINPKYNPTLGAGYDLALIKLKTGLSFDTNETKREKDIFPICLADVNPTSPNNKSTFSYKSLVCRLSGYANQSMGVTNTTLYTYKISLIETPKCKATYPDVFSEDYMVCAGDGATGACIGDHGASLICPENNPDYNKDNRYYLTGMASWGQTNCGENHDLFTKLYANDYLLWIKTIINT